MFEEPSSQFTSEIYQNVPNMSLMFTMYSPMFGNGNFMIQPASPGEVQSGFPSVPYLPLEAMIYQQQSSNPIVAPNNVLSGQHIGQQNIAGQYTAQDATGTTRLSLGYSNAT